MDELWVHALLLWPAVTVVSALFHMLIWWVFSWSELVFDALVGIALGIAFHLGTQAPSPSDADAFMTFAQGFMIFSHGLFGLIAWIDIETFGDREIWFLVVAASTVLGTITSSAMDRAAAAIGPRWSVLGTIVAIVSIVPKISLSLLTSSVGLLLYLCGGVWAAIARARDGGASTVYVGFAGAPFIEWHQSSGYSGTTFGCVIQMWDGRIENDDTFEHELYHTRQFIYLRDWLFPTWLLGTLWGLASSKIAGQYDLACATTAPTHRELRCEFGNPLERAAYQVANQTGTNCPCQASTRARTASMWQALRSVR